MGVIGHHQFVLHGQNIVTDLGVVDVPAIDGRSWFTPLLDTVTFEPCVICVLSTCLGALHIQMSNSIESIRKDVVMGYGPCTAS